MTATQFLVVLAGTAAVFVVALDVVIALLFIRWMRQAPRPDNPLYSPVYRVVRPYRNGANGTAEKEHTL